MSAVLAFSAAFGLLTVSAALLRSGVSLLLMKPNERAEIRRLDRERRSRHLAFNRTQQRFEVGRERQP